MSSDRSSSVFYYPISTSHECCVRTSHATVNSMLAKCINKNHRDWDEQLPQVAFCYNSSTHESMQYSPFFLLHGSEPRWDMDFKLGNEEKGNYSTNDCADLLLNMLEDAHSLAREHLQGTASRMQDWYDKKVHVQKFKLRMRSMC